MTKKHVIVIGAGASGMMAAIAAARSGSRVTILEHTSRSGRKIEITGNGKCNYTNDRQGMEYYHSLYPDYVQSVLQTFSWEDTVAFFRELGIEPKVRNGYYYPCSGQAQSVSQALRMEAERLKVKFACNINIREIRKNQNFEIITEGYCYEADAVILATGSCAAPATGSDGSGYSLAEKLGHQIRKPLPALVQLLSDKKELGILAGLRCEGRITMLTDGMPMETEKGEIQFIKNGLSGIPVFQLSGRAVRSLDEGKKVSMKVDFLAGIGWDNVKKELELRKERFCEKQASVQQFLNGILHERAQKAVFQQLGIKGSRSLADMSWQEFGKLTDTLMGMEFAIMGANGFKEAQVCSGGVCLEELKEKTLESALVENFYFAGEILDVDGACGGYNLQWAWASGFVAGTCAANG